MREGVFLSLDAPASGRPGLFGGSGGHSKWVHKGDI